MTEEEKRLEQATNHQVDWKKWGPYLSERAWGTVREDYSPDGNAWDYFPHDQAHARAYRWNEDGILGFCDRRQYLCFAIALWNGKDPILKERMFGLTNSQGNHGEDVKEYYYFLDGTPTHSYMKGLYKYPQAAYPYEELITENGRRTNLQPEYELIDTGVFAENRYYDVFVEYARADIDDLLIQISVVNRGPDTARLDLLPTLWYRNTWAWGEKTPRPRLSTAVPESQAVRAGCEKVIQSDHPVLGRHWLLCGTLDDGKNEGNAQASYGPELLYTENETNNVRLFGANCVNATPHVKDGINDYIVHGNQGAINAQAHGTKAAARYHLTVQPGETKTVRLRLVNDPTEPDPLDRAFDSVLNVRRQETDAFYEVVAPQGATAEVKRVQRQALAGMLWSKQYYHYAVENWLDGDPGFPTPPPQRQHGRNSEWRHLYNTDVFSMPDTWEYPWYAAWDLAFHCITLALVDATFAKRQLILLCREWSMHPNGELPAYEWAFGDVNPPVHAWAALRVYKIERRITGKADRPFLERIFHKLLLNFTWWVNRKDPDGRNVFQGGFLGLDNIGVFDRSAPLPDGERLEQSDGTAWMGLFCLAMFAIAVELARDDIVYEDMATKFFEHFLYIGSAMNNLGGDGVGLWDEEDQFFYDVLRMPNDSHGPGAISLKVRSLVGLIPLLAVTTVEQADLDRMPIFKERMDWFLNNRPDMAGLVSHWEVPGQGSRRLLALVRTHRMKALLRRMLDPNEFLSEHGIRSLSKAHEAHPYVLELNNMTRTVDYEPAESHTGLFGGNSNWRGPVWFPLNYLLIEALQRFDYYYGPEFKVECPTGSGQMLTLWQVSQELSRRLIHLFLREKDGRIPVFGANDLFQHDPNWCDYLPFHEYFHGDTGAGLGASHQTGWTGLVAKLIQQSGA